MKLIQRIGYYLGGFSIGLILLAFFLSGKKTSCAYGPQARVIKNINSKVINFDPRAYRFFTEIHVDSSNIKTAIKGGSIDFSRSQTRKEPCNIYLIESRLYEQPVEITVENCDSIAKILEINPVHG